MAVKYVAPFEDQVVPGDWRVEAMDEATGEIRIVIFKGDNAEKLAAEYHAFKIGKLPIKATQTATSPAPVPTPLPAPVSEPAVKVIGDESTFTGKTKAGQELVIRPSAFFWSYDEKREKVTGWRKKFGAVRKVR